MDDDIGIFQCKNCGYDSTSFINFISEDDMNKINKIKNKIKKYLENEKNKINNLNNDLNL